MSSDSRPIHEIYADEARKRLRPEGELQFQDVLKSDSARIRHLGHDAWADPAHPAPADQIASVFGPNRGTKFMIVGAGIGGIVSAVRLILAGFPVEQIRMVEAAGGVGGTWYWNRFPGLHCDIESYAYIPLLEEMGYMPSQKYASGVEIRQYLQRVVETYQLHDKIVFGTKVDSLEWSEQDRLWKAGLSTAQGLALNIEDPPAGRWIVTAENVILTGGYLSRPQVPKLDGAGIAAFKGDMFHTAIWDYNITGGLSEEVFPRLDKLKDKRVGIIGTGATAVQAVPCLAKHAKELLVFQRTPSAVYSRGQRETTEAEWREVIASRAGWHKERMENLLAVITAGGATPGSVDLVNDEWTKLRAYGALFGGPEWTSVSAEKIPELVNHFQELDEQDSARMRARLSQIVKDEATAKSLTPWYPVWCKRPTFSDTYLEAFNEPHVHLVDTGAHGVDKVTASGVVVRGIEHCVDVLILATGFTLPSIFYESPAVRGGIRIIGRYGHSMGEKWKEGPGMATLHGLATSGFPNLFWLGVPQSAVFGNFTHLLDTQAQHVAYILATAHERAAVAGHSSIVIEVEPAAEEAWSQRVLGAAGYWNVLSTCTPGYLSGEGLGLRMAHRLVETPDREVAARTARAMPWSAGLQVFLDELASWCKDGTLAGYRISGF